MSITILVTREGTRTYRTYRTVYDSVSTRIPGVSKTHWYGPQTRTDREYYSLTHVATGRALNKIPLTSDECDRLVDALIECPIEWDRISDDKRVEHPGIPYYVNNLTTEARQLAGDY